MIQNTEMPQQVIGLFEGDTDSRPVMATIRCITYNHEPYIRQTLEGFVMQKTNFRFEAIVHDDASTDGTAAIIREYAEKYPDIIKPIYETENQWSKHDGSLDRIMSAAARGKYMAYCEGDDYWIDPLKLQKQVDYLESHPNCVMCHSAFQLVDEKGKNVINFLYDYFKIVSGLNDSYARLLHGNHILTCTVCMKKEVLESSFYANSPIRYDYLLFLAAASLGYIHYDCEIMSCYRQTTTGMVLSMQSELSKGLDKILLYAIDKYLDNGVRKLSFVESIKVNCECAYLLYFRFLKKQEYHGKTKKMLSNNPKLKYFIPLGLIFRIYSKLRYWYAFLNFKITVLHFVKD